MRLFVALPLPEPVRRHLIGAAGALARAGEAALDDVRWVRPENLHVTLKFLGEVAEADVTGVAMALRHVAVAGPIPVRAERLVLQPARGRARLVAAEVGEVAAIRRLHVSVDEALEQLGFPRERRAFWPHVTLGRSRSGIDTRRLGRTLAGIVRNADGPAGEVGAFELVSSTLRPGGPIYATVATFSLAGPAG